MNQVYIGAETQDRLKAVRGRSQSDRYIRPEVWPIYIYIYIYSHIMAFLECLIKCKAHAKIYDRWIYHHIDGGDLIKSPRAKRAH